MNRLFLLLATLFFSIGTTAISADRPNVLFLFTDDQRSDTIAALGNPAIKTPNLDRLVRRGFAMNNAYCMGSTMGAVCNPSRHMTLSGMSLYRYRPNQKENTWGDVFRKAGYVTYHQSKSRNIAREYHKAFEFSSYLKDFEERKSGHHGRTAANDAIEFLDKKWDREKPLLMYIGFTGPHDPRVAAKRWTDLYKQDEIPLPANFKPFHPIDNGWMVGRDEKLAPWPRTEENVRKQLHSYYGCISSIDHHIGRIITKLKEIDAYDNTIIIFSSDHGLAIGSHGLFGKQNLYEHSMQAPLVFAGPGIPHGESDALMYLFDIFPTACDLAGVKIPKSLDGESTASVIKGRTSKHRETIFLAYETGQRAVRSGDWKLYRFPLVNHSMLFNLAEDPDELNDLARDSKQASKVASMMGLLASQQKRWDDKGSLSVSNPAPAEIHDVSFFARKKAEQKKRNLQNKKNKAGASKKGNVAGAEPFRLTTRSRGLVKKKGEPDHYVMSEKKATWDSRSTAIIICDMWDNHWCQGAARRVSEMAVPMNDIVSAARKKGVLIIHAPSSVVDFYANTPQRRLAQSAKFFKTPAPLSTKKRWGTGWCWPDARREPNMPIDDLDMGCNCETKCKLPEPGGKAPWTRQNKLINIKQGDAISHDGQEVFNLLEERKIDNVMIMGVHLNMCVLGRPFGIRQLVKMKKNVVLVRDLTDTMYDHRRKPFVDHFSGTDLVIEHVEKYWCPTITSDQIAGGKPFRFREDERRKKAQQ